MSTNAVIMRIILGGILAYSGFDLCKSVLADRPDNYIFFVLCGVVFMVVGVWFLIKTLKVAIRKEYDGGKVDIIKYEDKYNDEIEAEKEEKEE